MPVLVPALQLSIILPSKHLLVTCYVSSITVNGLDSFYRYFQLNFFVFLFCRLVPKAAERVLQYKVVDIVMSKLDQSSFSLIPGLLGPGQYCPHADTLLRTSAFIYMAFRTI